MSDSEPRRAPALERRRILEERVAVAPGASGVAFVPGRVLIRGVEAGERVVPLGVGAPDVLDGRNGRDPWIRVLGVADPLEVVAELRADGLQAQPEHVFFAHGCDGCALAPHPSVLYRALDPAPYGAHPHRANAYAANPHRANPHRANPHRANEALMSSAMPALERAFPPRDLSGPGAHPRITVLDTGLAGPVPVGAAAAPVDLRPPLLAGQRFSGDLDRPDSEIERDGLPPHPPDGWLDPVAGHGTFIAGLVEQLAPGCAVEVLHVIGPLGDAREGDVCKRIFELAARGADRPQLLSLSFGGSVLESAPALRTAIAAARAAGIVVVASAGNDGVPRPQYPAAFDQVLAVGALGPDGPAPWTNYGGWVDACAPGVDLVSAFFAAFDGPEPMVNGSDLDDFAEWATWSGTSFSTPVVVAALAREMVVGNCDAEQAVARVVRAPHLLRIPCLGTVVNI